MSASVEKVQDNTHQVTEGISQAILTALEAIGIEATSDSADICPVDTGRLRNSITHAVESDEKYVAVGTNVEYALYVHEGTRYHEGQHFLTDAVQRNSGKYRRILESSLKGN